VRRKENITMAKTLIDYILPEDYDRFNELLDMAEKAKEQYKKDHPWIDGGQQPEPDPEPNPDPNPDPIPDPDPDPILPPPGPDTGTDIMGDFFDRFRGFWSRR
jgi:hypothetical protein